MRKLKLIEFIRENENWREILSDEPYFLKITTDGQYTMFKYNQLCSDFNNEIVRECRGLILDENFNPVCVPFFKFGNYGESYCPEIDWGTARVQEKVDGSLIKVFYHDGEWRIATNGMIDAYKAELNNDARLKVDNPFRTFGELFDTAAKKVGFNYRNLDPNYTYMFELVSPFNWVVVHYNDIDIYHLGTRNNATLEEVEMDIGVKKPKMFNIHTLNDCVAAASELPFDEEGYVVVDANWNRVKVKSSKYVMAAYTRNNGCITVNRILDIIRRNEMDEFLLYCGDYKDILFTVQEKIDKIIERLNHKAKQLENQNFSSQKEFAFYIKDDEDKDFLFKYKEYKAFSACIYVNWLVRNKKIDAFAVQNGLSLNNGDKQKLIEDVTNYLENALQKIVHLRAKSFSEFAAQVENHGACDFLTEWYKRTNFSAEEYFWNLRNEQIERIIENV